MFSHAQLLSYYFSSCKVGHDPEVLHRNPSQSKVSSVFSSLQPSVLVEGYTEGNLKLMKVIGEKDIAMPHPFGLSSCQHATYLSQISKIPSNIDLFS